MGYIKSKLKENEMAETIITIPARLAFPSLFKMSKVGNTPGAPEKYSAALLIPKDSAAVAAIVQAMKAAAQEKWGAKWENTYNLIKEDGKLCLQNGDKKADNYDGFAGNYSINASSKNRPTVINRDKTPLNESDGVVYAGCYVNARVNFWAQVNQYGKRINCELKGIQFVKDGDAFGSGAPASADDFDDLSVGDTAGDNNADPLA
jgi:hypothetical protein